jgi:FlaA1/EpsC-like NDP-sugar epimerase
MNLERASKTIHSFLSNPLRRKGVIILWHTLGVILAYGGAFLIRFDFVVPSTHVASFKTCLPFVIIGFLFAFFIFRLYRGLWTYFSLDDVLRTVQAVFLGSILNAGMIYAARGYTFDLYPRSVFLSTFLFLLLWEAGCRFAVRWFKKRRYGHEDMDTSRRSIIIGEVEQADIMLRRSQALQGSIGRVVAIVSNDKDHWHLRMHRTQITGPVDHIGDIAREMNANTLIILPPHTSPKQIRLIVDNCSDAQVTCDFRVVPAIDDIASGRLDVSTIRQVRIEDLLNRDPAQFDRSMLSNYLRGKSVMITGAGGSIGSEIARQVAAHAPAKLVLFEMSEFALYSIEREIEESHARLSVIAYTGDVRSRSDLQDAILSAGNVDVIYHAAAYKHVPLMEKNTSACFHNNVIGSNNVATVARILGVERMVLISTDKAVRPTSVMGATKRLAERCALQQPSGQTSFVAVRFGNVLGSSGSVLPLFKRQIEQGGPVTVTTPDTRRHFMTIPEAVELVLMAGIVGEDRQIMVLEMGEPVKILHLARRLIELSGFVPEKDIHIEFIGLRPGEKEFEELMTEDEDVVETSYDKIWVLAKNSDINETIELDRIEQLIAEKDNHALRRLIADHVPESYFATSELPIQERIPSLEK